MCLFRSLRTGGGLQEGRGRGAGRVSAANWGMGGGLNIFFGAEMSTKIRIARLSLLQTPWLALLEKGHPNGSNTLQ